MWFRGKKDHNNQVIDIHAKAEKTKNIIVNEYEGFQFSIDLNRTSREQVLEQLNCAISDKSN